MKILNVFLEVISVFNCRALTAEQSKLQCKDQSFEALKCKNFPNLTH